MIGTIWLSRKMSPKLRCQSIQTPTVQSPLYAPDKFNQSTVHSPATQSAVRSHQNSVRHKMMNARNWTCQKSMAAQHSHKHMPMIIAQSSPLRLLKAHHFQFLGLVPRVRAKVSVPMVRGSAAANVAYGRCNTQTHADSSKHLANSLLDLQSRTNLHQ